MTDGKPPTWRGLRLGIFFLLGAIVFVTSLFIVGTNQHLFRRKYDLKAHIENAQGLATGAAITLSGLEVGRVANISFVDQDTLQAIELTLEIERRYQQRITATSIATLRTAGILGDKFVDLSLGDPGTRVLKSGETIPVRGSIDWAQTFERAVDVLDDLAELVDQTSATLERINRGEGALGMLVTDTEMGRDLKALTSDLAAVTGRLRRGDGALGKLLTDEATGNRLDRVVARLDTITEGAVEGPGLMSRALFDSTLADRFEALIADSDRLVTAVREGGTTGKLISDPALYDELRTSLEELRTLMADIKANPGRYIRVSIF